MGSDTGRGEQCTPVGGDLPVVFGDEVVGNVSSRPLRIDAVRLVRAEGLTIRDAFLLSIRDRTLLGTRPLPPAVPVWQDRREAVGARIAPGEEWNLALVLVRDGQPAGFADVEVAYTVGGDSSVQRLGYSPTVRKGDPGAPSATWCQPPA